MATPRRRKTPYDKIVEEHVAGWINIDIYRLSIPIFLTDVGCRAYCAAVGIEDFADESLHAVCGYAGWGLTKDRGRVHYVMLPSDSDTNTWVHEASHLADFIIDYLGLDPSIEGTEARAYLLAHIYASIEATMTDIQELLSIPEIVTAVPYNERPI